MLFKPELIKLILQKKKTQTRRLTKSNEYIDNFIHQKRHGATIRKRLSTKIKNKKGEYYLRTKYEVGKSYALQPGRGKPSIGRRILIKDIFHQPLLQITPKQAEKEGFQGINEFLRYFYKINRIKTTKGKPIPNPSVWVIKFELLPRGKI